MTPDIDASVPLIDLDALIEEGPQQRSRPAIANDELVESPDGRLQAPKVIALDQATQIAMDAFEGLKDPGTADMIRAGHRVKTRVRVLPADGILAKITPGVWAYMARRNIEIPREYLTTVQYNGDWVLHDAKIKFVYKPSWRWVTPKAHDPENMKTAAIVKVHETRQYAVIAMAFVDANGKPELEYERGTVKSESGGVSAEVASMLKSVFGTKDAAEQLAVDNAAQEALAAKDEQLSALTDQYASLQEQLDAMQALINQTAAGAEKASLAVKVEATPESDPIEDEIDAALAAQGVEVKRTTRRKAPTKKS